MEKDFLPARRNFPGSLLVYWMARRSLWKSFHAVRFRADEPLPSPPSQLSLPIIFYSNHSTWWDGYLAQIVTSQLYGLQGYLMMDVKQLRHYPFFQWAGVFSVDRENGRSALRSINYAVQELKGGNGRSLWIFPQGQIQPQERRPLGFQTGLAHIIRRLGKCLVYPVSFRFEFFREQYPEILISVGSGLRFDEPIPDVHTLSSQLEQTLTTQLDALRQDASQRHIEEFITVIRGKASTDTLVDSLMAGLRGTKTATIAPVSYNISQPGFRKRYQPNQTFIQKDTNDE